MCAFYLNKTGPISRNYVRTQSRSHHGETPLQVQKGFFPQKWTKKKKSCRLQADISPLCDFTKFIFSNYAQMINYTSSATGAAKLHLPRKAKIKLVRTHGPLVLYFYLELNQSDSESEGLPNLVWSGFLVCSLISHLPATVARAHEHSKNTNKRTGPDEAPC